VISTDKAEEIHHEGTQRTRRNTKESIFSFFLLLFSFASFVSFVVMLFFFKKICGSHDCREIFTWVGAGSETDSPKEDDGKQA